MDVATNQNNLPDHSVSLSWRSGSATGIWERDPEPQLAPKVGQVPCGRMSPGER